MLALTLWTLASALDYAAVPIVVKVFFAKGESVFYNFALVLFLAFGLSYAGYDRWLKIPWVRVIVWLPPIINIALTLTNDLHGLFWSGFTRSDVGDNIVIFHHGPAYSWVAITSYIAVMIMIVSLLRVVFDSSVIRRRQARLLLLALLIPLASNILYQFEIPGFQGIDWTSVFFSITALVFLGALFGTRFLDIVPVARHLMIEEMDDGVLVLDTSDRIVDFNITIQKNFDVRKEHLGEALETVIPDFPTVVGLSANTSSENFTIQVGEGQKLRYFDTRLTILQDNREEPFAKLVVFRDITERFRTEAALTERVKELKCIHDLSLLVEMPEISLNEILQGSVQLIASAMQFSELAWAKLILEGKVYTTERYEEVSSKLTRAISISGREVGIVEVGYLGSTGEGDGSSPFLQEESNLLAIVTDRLGQIIQGAWAEEKLHETQNQLMEQQRDLAKLEERQRMARTLHDSVSQSVHSVVLFSETLAATLERGNHERAIQIVERLKESARQTHKETRLLLYELQAEGPKRSVNLIQDLEERLARVERHAGMRAEIIHNGSLEACPLETKNHLYWIATEALNNAMKHAQANQIKININCSAENVEMAIMDDGIGFEVEKEYFGGMGLGNMKERAELIDGQLTIQSKPNEGTTVQIYVEM